MISIDALGELIKNHSVLTYFVFFVGIILEGELFLIFSGIVLHLGSLPILPVLAVDLAAASVKPFIAYYLGSSLHRIFSKIRFFQYMEKRVLFFFPRFREKPFWPIFLSKFLYGLYNVTAIFAGYSKINMRTFIKAEAFSTILWLSSLLGLGYFFSYAALGISKDIKKFSIIILLFIIGFILFERILAFAIEYLEERKTRK